MSANTRTAIVVLARADSSRLPGKALLDVAGRPLLGRVLDRVRQTPGAPRIVVATSRRIIDDGIADFAAAQGIAIYRGSAEDLVDRCLLCAEWLGVDKIVRISGDSPFMDPRAIAAVMARAEAPDVPELATNVFPRSWPPGASVEVLTVDCLRRIMDLTADSADREHVTRYVYRHPEEFRLANVIGPLHHGGVGLTVDTPDDLEKARWITRQLDDPALADLETVIGLARRWPALHSMPSGDRSPSDRRSRA